MPFNVRIGRFVCKHENWTRVALILPFVLLCYCFGWSAWRTLVCSVFVGLSHAMALPVTRASADTFYCNGNFYRFAIACTAIDAFSGSIPLLWMQARSLRRNALFFAGYFAVLMLANIARLALGLWIYLLGVPWSISHEAMAGVFYFALFLWIAQRRGWHRIGAWDQEWTEIESAIAG